MEKITISHTPPCPVADPSFVYDPLVTQCNCDFGERLRAHLTASDDGMPLEIDDLEEGTRDGNGREIS